MIDIQFADIILSLFGKSHSYQIATESNTDGEVTTTLSLPTTFTGAILPITGALLRESPNGEFTQEDVMVITKETETIKNGDVVTYDGQTYEVRTTKDYTNFFHTKVFIGKKVV